MFSLIPCNEVMLVVVRMTVVMLTLCYNPCPAVAAPLVASLPLGSHRRLGRQGVVVVVV